MDNKHTAFTVDLDPDNKLNPSLRTDAETLAGVPSLQFDWSRGDPPYTLDFAKDVYHNERLPDFNKILRAMARVTKVGGLVFMRVGQGCVTMEDLQRGEKPYHSGNLQDCIHYGLQRLGIITISVVPNREFRFLNIYGKVSILLCLKREDMARWRQKWQRASTGWQDSRETILSIVEKYQK